jgi:hypothetical protein
MLPIIKAIQGKNIMISSNRAITAAMDNAGLYHHGCPGKDAQTVQRLWTFPTLLSGAQVQLFSSYQWVAGKPCQHPKPKPQTNPQGQPPKVNPLQS